MRTNKRTLASSQRPIGRYPDAPTDAPWKRIRPLLPQRTFGRKPKHHPRILLNVICYLRQVGCLRRYLPADFPPYTTVSYYYHCWLKEGVLQRIHDGLRIEVRRAA